MPVTAVSIAMTSARSERRTARIAREPAPSPDVRARGFLPPFSAAIAAVRLPKRFRPAKRMTQIKPKTAFRCQISAISVNAQPPREENRDFAIR
jgi:hypothetical protein